MISLFDDLIVMMKIKGYMFGIYIWTYGVNRQSVDFDRRRKTVLG